MQKVKVMKNGVGNGFQDAWSIVSAGKDGRYERHILGSRRRGEAP